MSLICQWKAHNGSCVFYCERFFQIWESIRYIWPKLLEMLWMNYCVPVFWILFWMVQGLPQLIAYLGSPEIIPHAFCTGEANSVELLLTAPRVLITGLGHQHGLRSKFTGKNNLISQPQVYFVLFLAARMSHFVRRAHETVRDLVDDLGLGVNWSCSMVCGKVALCDCHTYGVRPLLVIPHHLKEVTNFRRDRWIGPSTIA